jgi:plastocyanin
VRARADASGNPNPLFEARRNPFINQGWGMPASTVDTAASFARKNFFHDPNDPAAFSFGGASATGPAFSGERDNQGSLEGTPHGGVHNMVGGTPATFSQAFPTLGTFPYRVDGNVELFGEVSVEQDIPVTPTTVSIQDYGPRPSRVRIGRTATVTWNNEGNEPHAIASDDETTFASATLAPVGYMRSLRVSARDPIFWMHHANIDRLWNRWLEPAVGGSNPPATETEWMDQDFTFFKPDQSPVTMCVKDVLSVYCLGYRYDDDPETEPAPITDGAITAAATPAARPEPRLTTLGENSPVEPIALAGERVTTPVDLDSPAAEALRRIATIEATPVADAVSPRIALILEGIQDTGSPGVTYEVYVNLPPDAEPDFRDDSFVGLINLFGLTEHGDHQGTDRQSFDITLVIRSKQERGELGDEITVTFVARGLVPPEALTDVAAADIVAAPFRATPGSWVTIDRISVVGIE